MTFDETLIHQVRSSSNITEVIGGYVRLRKSGQNQVGLCPFHQEKTPSFNVSESKQIFKCFGCQVGGDVIDFIQRIENLSFPEAVRYLAQRQGIPLPQEEATGTSRERDKMLGVMEIAQQHFRSSLKKSRVSQTYLSGRSIADSTVELYGLGCAPQGNQLLRLFQHRGISTDLGLKCGLLKRSDGGQVYDNFRNRIMVPIRNPEGRIIAFGGRGLGQTLPKYLNSPETPLYKKSRTLFGLDVAMSDIRQRSCAILVEGYFDCIMPVQAGFANVVASLGTSLTEEQVKLLRRYTNQLILSYDSDEAGLKATLRSLELLLKGGLQVNVLRLPGSTDPDTFIREHGGAAYRKRLISSQPGVEFALDYHVSAHRNPFSPRGKQEIVEELGPLLNKVPNRIERAEYVSRVAARLRIDPDLVLQQVRRLRGGPRRSRATAARVAVEVRPAERVLFKALLDAEIGPSIRNLVDLELLEGLASHGLFQTALELWESGGPPEIPRLRDGLDEEADVHLLETISLSTSAEIITEDAARESVRSLMRLRLDQKKKALRARLESEEAQDPGSPLIDKFLEELDKIERERLELEHSSGAA